MTRSEPHRDYATRLVALNEIAHALSAAVTAQEMFECVSQRLSSVVHSDRMSYARVHPDGKHFSVLAVHGNTVISVGSEFTLQGTSVGAAVAVGTVARIRLARIHLSRINAAWRWLDLLKIDHGFVDGMQSDARKYGIVKGIASMARSLSLVCIAEGGRNRSTAGMLACDGLRGRTGLLAGAPKCIG